MKIMPNFLLLLFLLLPSTILAQDFTYGKDQEIVVTLPSKSPLLSTAVLPFSTYNSSLNASYLDQLKEVVSFDFDHNSKTKVPPLPVNTQESPGLDEFNLSFWKEHKFFYVIKGKVESNALQLALYSLTDEKIHKPLPIMLTGNINQDRQSLHHLCDSFYESLFNEKGVASSKLIYSLRKKAPDGSHKWLSEVYQIDYDGHNPQQLTSEGSYIVTPTAFPHLKGIQNAYFFYVSYQTGQPKIYIANAQNPSFKKRLTSLRGNQFMPVLSPKGDRVAFISDAGGRADLFLMGFDPHNGPQGKPYQIFSAPQATQASPSFHPNGKQIAFVSDKSGLPRIYVMDIPPPGTRISDLKLKLISQRNTESTSPAWSPDGKKIAFSSKTNGVRQIWVYNLESGEERQVTFGNKHKENPTWAHNSKHLIFNTADAYYSELFLINLNDKEAVQITSGYGEKRFPYWLNT